MTGLWQAAIRSKEPRIMARQTVRLVMQAVEACPTIAEKRLLHRRDSAPRDRRPPEA